MSAAPTLTVRVHIVTPAGGRLPPVELALPPATALRDLLGRLARTDALPPGAGWTFRARDGTVLQPTDTLREVAERYGGSGAVLELILVPMPAPGAVGGPGPTAPPAPAAPGSLRTLPTAPPPPEEDERAASFEVTFPTDRAAPPPAPAPAPARARLPAAAKAKKAPDRGGASGGKANVPPPVERRATVRYYTRMNPDRMFPLLVILSAQQVQEIVKARVKQAVSEAFQVADGSVVEVEPVIPGCDCYPPRHTLAVGSADAVTEAFWIVPRVLGRVHGARVLVRQGDRVLAEVPLEIKVAKQTLAVACGLLSIAAPYLTMALKSLKLDYESQKADGFPLYQRAGSWVAENLRPEWLGLGFLGLAALLYLWMRPRRRDVFWDVSANPVRKGGG